MINSLSSSAWVGSVSVGVMYVFGPITSGLSERLGCRVVAISYGIMFQTGKSFASLE